jgi:DNA-binding response OmpR family regulator
VLGYLASQEPGSLPPFVVFSEVDDLDVLRACFERGAADFIRKPFSKGELLVKIERLLSPRADFSEGLCDRWLKVDAATMRAECHGAQSDLLTAKEFQILNLIRTAPRNRLPRREIVRKVWGEVKVVPKTFDVHLFNLRRKLEPLGVRIQFHPPGDYALSFAGRSAVQPRAYEGKSLDLR